MTSPPSGPPWSSTSTAATATNPKPFTRSPGPSGAPPDRADALIPILALAVRSTRPPERRAGLAALAQLAEHHPETQDAIRQHVPELTLAP